MNLLGVDGAISLLLRPNLPRNVECGDQIAAYPDNCDELIASIPTSSSPLQVFGPAGKAGVDQILPKGFATGRKLSLIFS